MTELELFEEWIKKEDIFSGDDDDPDVVWAKKFMFKAWQASTNREGYKLVSVEPSKACLDNLGNVIFDNFGTTTTEVDRCAEKAYKAMIGACDG